MMHGGAWAWIRKAEADSVATDTLALALGGEALDQFTDGLVDRIAAQVFDRLNEQHLDADRWMDSAEAARYIVPRTRF